MNRDRPWNDNASRGKSVFGNKPRLNKTAIDPWISEGMIADPLHTFPMGPRAMGKRWFMASPSAWVERHVASMGRPSRSSARP